MSTIKTLTDSSEPLPQIRQQSFALDHLPPSEKGLPGKPKEAADSLIPLPVDVPSTIRKKPAMDSTARSPVVPAGHRQQCRTMMKKRKMSDEHPHTNMEVVSAEKDFSVFPKPLPLKLRFADEGRDRPPGVDNDANVTDVLKEAEKGGREATPPTVPPRMLFRQPSSSMPRLPTGGRPNPHRRAGFVHRGACLRDSERLTFFKSPYLFVAFCVGEPASTRVVHPAGRRQDSDRRGISPGAEETRGVIVNGGYRRPSGGSPTRPMTLAAASSLPRPSTHDYVTAGTLAAHSFPD
ncbi:hypothetical protein HPB52_021331 [Rhipicephalus sanguineus]|uniref:Uncharacterized protein n=1 Tax=Rhipicephalus sanguineus TaxID=34632 RepID=A0A9D4PCN8_RHISA|nr:hypothetical protein HPB52_021331 [Rhipicephalus sanguineus]